MAELPLTDRCPCCDRINRAGGKRAQNPFFLPFLIPQVQFIARLQGWQVKRMWQRRRNFSINKFARAMSVRVIALRFYRFVS
jgi:radical SAM superfamily enzyme with C-terminal helix-hairpin-helix motif